MNSLLRGRNLPLFGTSLLLDEQFYDPTLSRWNKTDTENKITVSGGNVVFAGGKATPGWADPALVSKRSWARKAGLYAVWECTPGDTGSYSDQGFANSILDGGGSNLHSIMQRATGYLGAITNTYSIITPLAYSAAQSLLLRIVCILQPDGTLKGARYEVSADNGLTWKLIWIDRTVTTSPLYPFVESYNAALTDSKCQVGYMTPKPPVVSLVPSAPSVSLGLTAITNGDMETGSPPSSWSATGSATLSATADERTGGTGAQSLSIINTASSGGTQQTVACSVGSWYQATAYLKRVGAVGCYLKLRGSSPYPMYQSSLLYNSTSWGAVTIVGRTTQADIQLWVHMNVGGVGDEVRIDDVILQPLTLASLLTSGSTIGTRYGVYTRTVTCPDSYQRGFVCCLDSQTTPLYYLHAYVDKTAGKAYLLKVVNGVTTELIAAAITYADAKDLVVVVCPGSSGLSNAGVALYWNGAQQGTTQTVDLSTGFRTDAWAFQTDTGTPAENFIVDVGVGL